MISIFILPVFYRGEHYTKVPFWDRDEKKSALLHMQEGVPAELTGQAAEQAALEAFGEGRSAVVIEIIDRRTGEAFIKTF